MEQNTEMNRMEFKDMTMEHLYDLYLVKDMTDAQIACLFCVSDSFVRRKRAEYHIESKVKKGINKKNIKKESPKTHKLSGIDPTELKRLYVDEGMSQKDIGKLLGVSDVAIGYQLKKHCIESISARTRTSSKAISLGLKSISNVSAQELKDMYMVYGMRKLAKQFGCSKTMVKSVLEENSIQAIGKTERIVESYPEHLNQTQMDIIYGSLMGDGHIQVDGDSSGRYSEGHCFEQLDYLKWKHNILMPFSRNIVVDNGLQPDGRISYGYRFKTCNHPIFLDFSKRFYVDGKKRFPLDFKEMINPLVLACWYMDDGHLSDRREDGMCSIFSSTFSYDEMSDVRDFLNEMGLDVILKQYSSFGDGTMMFIQDSDKFCELIQPHMIECMEYKLKKSFRGLNSPNHPPIGSKAFFDGNPSAEDIFNRLRRTGFPVSTVRLQLKEEEILKMRNSSMPIGIDGLIPNGYSAGTSLCISYFNHFWEAKRSGKKSPIEAFNDDKCLMRAITHCLKNGKVTDTKVRNELQTFGGVHNFRPEVCKALLREFCPKGGAVLDPCSGWGGRLLGFMSSDASTYVGCEVEERTVDGLNLMAGRLESYFIGKNVFINHIPFEKFTTDDRFDLVFTSPPYFDAEDYGSSENQSSSSHLSYDSWRDNFLKVLVTKSVAMLKPGGRLILNVANSNGNPIADDTEKFISEQIGIDRVLQMVYQNWYTGATRYEPIFVSKQKS